MSVKIVLLICIISCSNGIFSQVSSSIINDMKTGYEKIRESLDKANNATSIRTMAELSESGNKFTTTLDFIGLVEQYDGYKAEEYDVQTEDGYILKLHRITSSPLSPKAPNKPVVYMQHCLLASSDIYVISGPNHDLAFLLANAGYDIWLGNVRGNTYSMRHVNYSSASTNYNFWNFNLDDIAMKDMPVFIDTVLEKTNKKKLTYIGYSMGSALIFMLTSSKPEYNGKINLVINLAPAVYFVRPYSAVLERYLVLFQAAIPLLRDLQLYNLFPRSKLQVGFDKSVCQSFFGKILCGNYNHIILSVQNTDFYFNDLSALNIAMYSGSSLDVVIHYSQLVSSEKFRKFDFGPGLNREKYNASEPPEYDLSKVTAPQAIFYSVRDILANPQGMEKLKKQLPNVIAFEKVPESYNHLDFVWAKDARLEYHYKVLKLINKFSQ